MQILVRHMSITLLLCALSMAISQATQAHLMPARHGTLNIVDDGAFMVLSLPISAFDGIDDDSDGKISMLEFNRHRSDLAQSIRQKVTLEDRQGSCSLHGIVFSPVTSHDSAEEPVSQLVVMGRFILNDSVSPLRFHIGLFGDPVAEQSLKITATREDDNQRAVFELSRDASANVIFSDTTQNNHKPVVWFL
ncbi:MAG: hypothetical protein V7746_18430 [Halioglobus sp.]